MAGMSTLTTVVQHSIRSLSNSNQKKKEIKHIQIGKAEVKLSLFTDDMILYVENLKDATKKLLELIRKFYKSQDTKNQCTEIYYISIHQ